MGKLNSTSVFFKKGTPALIGEASPSVLQFMGEHASGHILDLGGGQGAYAYELMKREYAVVLGEIDADSITVAEKNGIPTLDMNQIKLDELKNKFDTIAMIEVLEHVTEYRDFLFSAFRNSKSKVIFTVPCNDDFLELFGFGLTYNHIAVSDHVNQFTSTDIERLLADLPCTYTIKKGDYLFPSTILPLIRKKMMDSFWGKLSLLPVRLANKFGLLPKFFPTRLFVVLEKK